MTVLFVTDLDGTLLDHATYSYAPALPALTALRKAGCPLVLATSKTAAEVAPLHADLGLGDTPAIVENGAGILRHNEKATGASAYAQIRTGLAAIEPDLRHLFTGFGDMSADDVAQVTGLPLPQAALAKDRQHSEPGVFAGSASQEETLCAGLQSQGIHARRGGRFLTLSLGRTKADALAEVARELQASRVVALGDAPNDIEMLHAADIGVIIRNDHGPQIETLPQEATGRIRRSQAPGPSGWNTAVLQILQEMQQT